MESDDGSGGYGYASSSLIAVIKNGGSVSTHKTCLHCQLPLDPSHTIGEGFCCHGCETVYQLLNQEGLNRFYDLSDGQKPPVQVRTDGDYGWVEDKVESGCLDISINGIHCSACVWLLE